MDKYEKALEKIHKEFLQSFYDAYDEAKEKYATKIVQPKVQPKITITYDAQPRISTKCDDKFVEYGFRIVQPSSTSR